MRRIALATLPALVLAAAAAAWWSVAPAMAAETRAAVLLGALGGAFAFFFVTTRQPRHVGLKAGVYLALLAVCVTEIWLGIGIHLTVGPFSISRAAAVLGGRLDGVRLVLMLGPLPGLVLVATQLPDVAFVLFNLPPAGGDRRRAKSDLYGKSEFMSRRDRRRLETGRGLLLGQSGRNGRSALVAWPLEGSAITVAPPRTGKGATIALNLLSPNDRGPSGSTLTIDPRGESYCIVARRRRAMGRNVILVDPFGMVEGHARSFPQLDIQMPQSQRYNPLDFIRKGEAEAVRDIGVLLDALLTPPTSDTQNTSQHFYQSAREIIAGYIAWVRFNVKPPNRNLDRVRQLLSEDVKAARSRLDKLKANKKAIDPGGLTRKALERRGSVGPEEAGSQASTIANQLTFLAQPDLLVNTSESTFDPAVISDGNTDLFIVVPDDMVGEVRGWIRLWITIPNAIPNRQALERDLLLIIDEMPRLGFLKPVMDAYNLAAGKGVHFWCFSQSISALEATWGKEQTRTLIDLAEVVQILGFPRTDAQGAESMAKAIGQATFEAPSTSESGTVSEQRVLMASSQVQTGQSTQLVREYLVQPDDLMTMAPDEQYIVAAGKTVSRNALHLYHARYWERRDARHLADGNPFVVRKAAAGLTAPPAPRKPRPTTTPPDAETPEPEAAQIAAG